MRKRPRQSLVLKLKGFEVGPKCSGLESGNSVFLLEGPDHIGVLAHISYILTKQNLLWAQYLHNFFFFKFHANFILFL